MTIIFVTTGHCNNCNQYHCSRVQHILHLLLSFLEGLKEIPSFPPAKKFVIFFLVLGACDTIQPNVLGKEMGNFQ